VKIWNQDEGVLVTRVAATHEDRFGQPAGTFGAHRGADLKHQVPPQVSKIQLQFSREFFKNLPRSTVYCEVYAVSPIAFGSVRVFVVRC